MDEYQEKNKRGTEKWRKTVERKRGSKRQRLIKTEEGVSRKDRQATGAR